VTPSELREEIAIEFEAIEITVGELLALQQDIVGREPSIREKTAAAAFLAQFYSGIENILKRICRYYDVSPPTGDTWHVELFQRFCNPSHPPLPTLFDDQLAADLAPYRRFRHVAFQGYGFQLDWERMAEGVGRVHEVFSAVKIVLNGRLQSLDS
jgi:hypothetical protein